MRSNINKGSTVLFQGDSITDCNRIRDDGNDLGEGYPAKIAKVWDSLFPETNVRFFNRGISGNRSQELLDRYQKDFLSLKPDMVSILIGINDTWKRYSRNNPTSPEKFEQNYRTILQNLKQDLPSVLIVIIEPFLLDVISERNSWREDLDPKILVVRRLAKEFADVFIPMDGIFTCYAMKGICEEDMSIDGVHPTNCGHGIIATEWLKAMEVF
jgi:lysophospholipase L1-like esterase